MPNLTLPEILTLPPLAELAIAGKDQEWTPYYFVAIDREVFLLVRQSDQPVETKSFVSYYLKDEHWNIRLANDPEVVFYRRCPGCRSREKLEAWLEKMKARGEEGPPVRKIPKTCKSCSGERRIKWKPFFKPKGGLYKTKSADVEMPFGPFAGDLLSYIPLRELEATVKWCSAKARGDRFKDLVGHMKAVIEERRNMHPDILLNVIFDDRDDLPFD